MKDLAIFIVCMFLSAAANYMLGQSSVVDDCEKYGASKTYNKTMTCEVKHED